MKHRTFLNLFLSLSFFGAILLGLVAISPGNAMAQASQVTKITVEKLVCDSIGDQNTCNGRISNLNGVTVEFIVYDVTGIAPNTPRESLTPLAPASGGVIAVPIGAQGNGSQGTTTTDNIYTTGNDYLVCENVPNLYDTLPRPDATTGGANQTSEGDCIRFNALPGNNKCQFINYLEDLGPTSAHASISGRVLDPRGRGVSRARVAVTDSTGFTRTVLTNPFGYYRFEDLPTGEIYIIGGFHKRYVFTPLVVNLMEDLSTQNLSVQANYPNKLIKSF